MGACFVRYDLQSHIGQVCCLFEMMQLRSHHRGPADHAVQDGFVEHSPQLQRRLAGKHLLAP